MKFGKCLPDVKSIEVESPDKFTATVRVGVGLIRTDLKFRIQIEEKQPIDFAHISATASGSGNNILLDLKVYLKEMQEGTELRYSSEVNVAGMMAGLGQRMISDTAGKTVKSVFECVKRQVE